VAVSQKWIPELVKSLKESTDTKTLYYAVGAAANMNIMNKDAGGM
jgi:hypothetical protein